MHNIIAHLYLFINILWSLKGPIFLSDEVGRCLTAKAVEGAALPLQGLDHIHGSDSLPLGMLSVGDSVPDDVLKEHLEDTSGLLVDQARDTLDTSTSRQTANSGLGDTLDVITQDFAMTLSASLSKSFSSFASSGHVELYSETDEEKRAKLLYILCAPASTSSSASRDSLSFWRG